MPTDSLLSSLSAVSSVAGTDLMYLSSAGLDRRATIDQLFTSPALTGTPTAPTAASNVSTTQLATTAFVQAVVTAAVVGLLDFKGSTNASSNPNYPAASKGDAYYISAAGKIGGASGKSVDIGDVYVANADNAGGTEGSVGTSWFVLEHNLVGAMVGSNNLSEITSASTSRSNLGLGTAAVISATAGGDLSGTLPSPTVAKINGVAVTGTPSSGQVPTATGATAATWQTPSGSVQRVFRGPFPSTSPNGSQTADGAAWRGDAGGNFWFHNSDSSNNTNWELAMRGDWVEPPGSVTLGTPDGTGIPGTMPDVQPFGDSLILQCSIDGGSGNWYDITTNLGSGEVIKLILAYNGGSAAGHNGELTYFRAKNTNGGVVGPETSATTVGLPAAPDAPPSYGNDLGSQTATYDCPASVPSNAIDGDLFLLEYNIDNAGWVQTDSPQSINPAGTTAIEWIWGNKFATPSTSFKIRFSAFSNIYGTGAAGAEVDLDVV